MGTGINTLFGTLNFCQSLKWLWWFLFRNKVRKGTWGQMSAVEVRKQKEASNAPIIPFAERSRSSQVFAPGILASHDLVFTGYFFLCSFSSLSPPAASPTRRRKQVVVIAGLARPWAKPSRPGETRRMLQRDGEGQAGPGGKATKQAPHFFTVSLSPRGHHSLAHSP